MQKLALDVLAGLAGLVFPPACEHCGSRSYEDAPLCWRCMRSLERPPPEEATRILEAFPADNSIRLHCLWYFDRQGPLRDVVHALKYRNRPWYGDFLGEALAESIGEVCESTIVAPLPIHRIRLLERGYNQALWIARAVARRLDAYLASDLLSRARATPTQTALSREARWRNVSDAFSASTDGGRGSSHVLLVDDVVTTGATAVSAALTLRRAGVDTVTIAALGLARA